MRIFTSVPFTASAISCTANGLTVVRAPIQSTSTPNSSALSTCLLDATSVAIGRPVRRLASDSHASPLSPTPSKVPGRVRGFQIPARRTSTTPVAASLTHVSSVCSRVSALHGPDMIRGRLAPSTKFSICFRYCRKSSLFRDSRPVISISVLWCWLSALRLSVPAGRPFRACGAESATDEYAP